MGNKRCRVCVHGKEEIPVSSCPTFCHAPLPAWVNKPAGPPLMTDQSIAERCSMFKEVDGAF